MAEEERTPVLIVGGGLAGLSAALFLAWHGVPALVVERHAGTSRHPRARGIHPRAMELMRQVGLETSIRTAESARALADNRGVIAVETLAGREIGELRESYFLDSQPDLDALSPTSWCLCHQDEYEPLLVDRARELGAEIRFNTEVVSFEQDDEGVSALLRDRSTGRERRVRARWLIAADGAESPVRKRLGIGFPGTPPLGHYLNVHFRADLRDALGSRRFIMCYTMNRAVRGALMPLDNAYRWLLHALFDPSVDDPATFDERRCADLVRAATGLPDLEVDVIGVLPWSAPARVAEAFRAGDVFLVGDAAHQMPPSGAFGSNTGIQDAHNLAWKLAAVIRGEAGPALLDTYDAERRPAAAATVRQAVLRSKDRPRLVQEAPAPPDPEIVPDSTVWFGWRYAVDTGDPEASDPGWEDQPSGAPGARAPHVPLSRDGVPLSTLDLVDRRFVLLSGELADDWHTAGDVVARRLGIDLDRHRPGADGLLDLKGTWTASFGVTSAGCVLIRPDGVVAWRAPAASATPERDLADALARALAHQPADPRERG